MRFILSLIVMIATVVLILSVFTLILPPGISNPVRGIYNQGVYFFTGLARSIGINTSPAYYLVGVN